MTSAKFTLPNLYQGYEESVWVEFTELALEHKPLNLGVGVPDFAPQLHVTKALADIATKDNNCSQHQYTRSFGHSRLVAVLSELYSQLLSRKINPLTEILITIGANEALYSCIHGHISPGDEIILIEPFFSCYKPIIKSVKGMPVFIPLRPKPAPHKVLTSRDWVLDPDELASKFNSKTKAIIVNTPHNPTGKVFTLEELTMIADLCKKWDVLYISDEIYENMVYKPNKHIRVATLPGMWERTITIGSAGKTFSVTGWKTGWAYGPANLMKNLFIVHETCVFTCCTPIQEALAQVFEIEVARLGSPESYFESLPRELEAKRDFMIEFLSDAGMAPTVPEGGYFIVADWTGLNSKIDLSSEKDKYNDYRFAKWMIKNAKLLGIPQSAFYSGPNKYIGESYIRYCFIKKDETLQKAAQVLKNWKESI